MSYLKKQNLNHCVSLLKQYIDNTPVNGQKRGAILALNQLQKISAGAGTLNFVAEDDTTDDGDPNCNDKPKANVSIP